MTLEDWNPTDLRALLTLAQSGPSTWRSRFGDANLNGRSYGGQLLGQAMAAALQDAPEDRHPSLMQLLFLQGAVPDKAIDFTVTRLQDGKRFSSRHVRGAQRDRFVLDAQVTCARDLDAPAHMESSSAPAGEDPETLDRLADVPEALLRQISRLGGYSDERKPSIEFRIPEATRQLDGAISAPKFRFWMKVNQALGEDGRLQAAAFAYISDWWLNFSSLASHLQEAARRRLYISSLNHAIWLHRPARADAWLHVASSSPRACAGRGLSVARVHDLEGCLVASATQESLMAYVD